MHTERNPLSNTSNTFKIKLKKNEFTLFITSEK